MMEFLVLIDISLPIEMPEERRRALVEAEGKRAAQLRLAGTLTRIWRVPGRRANWSLYSVADPDELHEALASLPLWPWMSIVVHTLAVHPAEQ
jgi:muconolactone D-isomerase